MSQWLSGRISKPPMENSGEIAGQVLTEKQRHPQPPDSLKIARGNSHRAPSASRPSQRTVHHRLALPADSSPTIVPYFQRPRAANQGAFTS